jgi:hypothetical protein
MYSKIALCVMAFVGHGWRSSSSVFDGGEEGLGDRVVPTLPLAADREPHLVVLREARVLGRGALAFSIGMKDHARLGPARMDGVTQRLLDQIGP